MSYEVCEAPCGMESCGVGFGEENAGWKRSGGYMNMRGVATLEVMNEEDW